MSIHFFPSQRGKQRLSYVAMVILALLWLTVVITLFVSVGHKLSWLNFLYIFSYVKLAVTLIKYIPQVGVGVARWAGPGQEVSIGCLSVVLPSHRRG